MRFLKTAKNNGQELQPHIAIVIIHKQEEVPPTIVYGWRDWPVEIAVDELESVHHVILGRLWERQDPLLSSQVTVTQLACVLDVGQPWDYLLQPTERVEAEMAKPGMP